MRSSSAPTPARALAVAVTCLVTLAACDDTAAPTPPGSPSFGADVVHGVDNFWVRLTDGGYSLYAGITEPELAQQCATGSDGAYEWDDLAVFRPNGGLHFRDNGKEVPVVVWQEAFYEPCLGDAPVFATGSATVTYTDNDATGAAPGGNSFGFAGNGIVTTAGGDEYRLHFHARVAVRPDGGDFKERMDINLTPIR